MRNLYFVVATTFLLAACGGGSGSGSGGETPTPDTTSPIVTVPSAATFAAVDATGASASNDAIATFLQDASATDDVDGSVPVTNDAPDTFSLGDTTVTFSASDAAGNTATATAVVTVTDQTAPTLSAPADSSFVASSAEGIAASDTALAEFLAQATASDNVDAAVTVIDDDGGLSIGKFPSVNDERPVTKGEVLAMTLAKTAGIRAAEARLVESDGLPVALIRRFDRTDAGIGPFFLALH